MIEQFIADLQMEGPPEVINYEWYYDGRRAVQEADGYKFSSCENPFSYSQTDLVDLGNGFGVESDVQFEGEGEGEGDEIGSLRVGLVLVPRHEICAQIREISLYELAQNLIPSLGPSQLRDLPDLGYAYGHLFDLQLYRLLIEASAKISSRAPWIFVSCHGRWPVLVGSPEKN